jgi:glycine/D-amino acid oxidase-like deaminating enzyme
MTTETLTVRPEDQQALDPDVAAGVVAYQTDDQARPGRLVEALARLLIDLHRRRGAAGKNSEMVR